MIDFALGKLRSGSDLSRDEAQKLFTLIFDGVLEEESIADLLLALAKKGESASEIEGAVLSMREHMIPIDAPDGAIDIVGTGGDGHGTFNISTAAAFVAAGAGAIVAKHGNRSASSISGASDVLGSLGVRMESDPRRLEDILRNIGIVFLFAPHHHPAMRHVAPIRKKLGVRTIFNILGPMTNPANVRLHLIGVFDSARMEPMAHTLSDLGSFRAWVAHGAHGLDELSTTGETDIVSFEGPRFNRFLIAPEQAGLARVSLTALKGGDAAHNAQALRDMLHGHKGPYRDVVLLNAGAALCVAGIAASIEDGVARAAASIDTGAAARKLDDLVKETNA